MHRHEIAGLQAVFENDRRVVVFDAAHKFINGFARAEIDNKWGIIDKEGKWFIEPKYKEIGDVVILNDN